MIDMNIEKIWFVYILRCSNNSLYTGITTNLERRFNEHLKGTGAKYTRTFKPLKMVYFASFPSKSLAAKEEYRIKKLKKSEKELLILGGKND